MPRRWFIAAALAAVLPFTLIACGGDDTTDNLQDEAGNAATKVGDAAGEAASNVAGVAPVTFDIKEQGGSGVSGNAVLTPEGSGRSRVSLTLDAKNESGKQYAIAIVEGDCGSAGGAAAYDLGQVGEGQSTKTAGAGIQELKDGNFALTLRDGGTVVACGAIS